jgi:hypothetical protein
MDAAKTEIFGNRQHYLVFQVPQTWVALEEAGFKYDLTLGFNEHEGFRCGICYPYKPFDVIKREIVDIWELPLTVMDGSIFAYQKVSVEQGLERVKVLIDTVERYNGVFVPLWHNSSFYIEEDPRPFLLYKEMLQYLNTKSSFHGTAGMILQAWEKSLE